MGQSVCCLYNIRRYRSDGTTYWHRDYAGDKNSKLLDLTTGIETLLTPGISNNRSSGNPLCIDSNENYVVVGGQWIRTPSGDPEYYNVAVYNYDGSLRWRQALVRSGVRYNCISICIDENNNVWVSGGRVSGAHCLWKFDINGVLLTTMNFFSALTLKRRIGGGVWFNGAIPAGDLSTYGLNYNITNGVIGTFYFDSNNFINGLIIYQSGISYYGVSCFTFGNWNQQSSQFDLGIQNFCQVNGTSNIYIGKTIQQSPGPSNVTLFPAIGKSSVENRIISESEYSNTIKELVNWGVSPKDQWYSYGELTLSPGDIPNTIPEYNINDYNLYGYYLIQDIKSIDTNSSTGTWISGRYWDGSRNTIRLAKIDESTGNMIIEFDMQSEFNVDAYPNYGYFKNLICLSDSHLVALPVFSPLKGNYVSKIHTSGDVEFRHKHLVYSTAFIGHSSTMDGGFVAACQGAYRIGAGEISFIE